MDSNVYNSEFDIVNPLKDILAGRGRKNKKTGSNIFDTYIDKEQIGAKIFEELNKRFIYEGGKEGEDGRGGFKLTDTSNEVGLLSQCQSLQALLILASDFGLKFTHTSNVADAANKLNIRQMMDAIIADIIQRRVVKSKSKSGESGYIFDASPYDSAHFSVEYSNVDAITWVLPTFYLILKYHASIHERCKWEKQMVDIIIYGLKYLNDAYIPGDAKANVLTMGWNFTKDCEEPSLYYTFAVCECYLDLYNTFENHLKYLSAEKISAEVGDNESIKYEYPAECEEYHNALEEQIAEFGEPNFDKDTVSKRVEVKSSEDYEIYRLYRKILGSTGLFEALESKCKTVANKVWALSQDKLADAFFYNDLGATISDNEIKMSTTSDALFNTVYIINILIDSGLHNDMLLKQMLAGDDKEEYLKQQRAYNELLEVCQLAIQKAFRTYESLKKEGKDYIVDQFLIGFNENFTVHADRIRELRKLRMRVFSLVPLLIHTNNVVSEYLVRYPQVSMKKYLGYILENRYTVNKKTMWIWEADGYFSASNYYFVSALGEFYSYYRKYEQVFIADGYDRLLKEQTDLNRAALAELKAEKESALKAKDEEITRLKNEVSPIERAIMDVVQKSIAEVFPTVLAEFLEGYAKGIFDSEVDPTRITPEQQRVKDAIREVLIAYLSAPIVTAVSGSEYASVLPRLLKDSEDLLKFHIQDIANSTGDRSRLTKFVHKEKLDSGDNK